MGGHVVGWISTLWFTANPSGNTILQFPKNPATGKGKDTNHREK